MLCDCNTQNENGLTEQDIIWSVAKRLFDEGFFSKIECTIPNYLKHTARKIFCFLPDFTDLQNVIRTGTELRKRLNDYPHPLYLKTFKSATSSLEELYMICIDGDLYRYSNYGWRLLMQLLFSVRS